MKTVSLQIIVKDEYQAVLDILANAVQASAFNEINLTVSDKTTANKLSKLAEPETGLHVQYRAWTDDFAAARNANYAMSTTDYTFWLDADDKFDFSVIPGLVKLAEENNIDAIFLPYHYAHDENGQVIVNHWRERLVRAGKGFSWRGVVHETYITDEKFNSHMVDNPVIHNPSADHATTSRQRNYDMLVKLCEGKDAKDIDPRYLFYLGMTQFGMELYGESVETLTTYLEYGGSVEDTYRALAFISEAAYHMGKHSAALEYATKCLVLKPEYPHAYHLMAQYEADQQNWKEALEWVRASETKPDPKSLSVYDPSARERAALLAAQAEFMLQNYNAALAWLRKAPHSQTAKDLYEDFKKEADAETFTNLLPNIRQYFRSDKALWNALCDDLRYDTRIKGLRETVTEPKTWGDKSVVIFCGQGYEEWGPHTLDKGMGGSEEAVVYLSRELAKLGYEVTVFGEAEGDDSLVTGDFLTRGQSQHVDWHLYNGGKYPQAVRYRPWKEIDTRDNFNIFVSWRAPQFLEHITAKAKFADIHDVLPEEVMKDYPDVTYFVKSAYHRGLYPAVPDERFEIIGNGISKEQFKETK